jgi:hypothetical protein
VDALLLELSEPTIREVGRGSFLRERGVGTLDDVKDAFLERSGKINFIFWADPH